MQRAFITNVEKFWRAVIFPSIKHACFNLAVYFLIVYVYIAFLCSTISVLIMSFRAQLVISNWMYLNHYGCFCFSLTKVIHMLAYSFFAPTIYVWIICHRRACVDTVLVKLLSCVWLFEIPWTVAYQAPPSMEFSRQEYWSGLPFPSPGDIPNPGI